METQSLVPEYWNHNTAYHRWILKCIGNNNRRILDVGCGEGLLMNRLLPRASLVIGIDPDPGAIKRAGLRLTDKANALFETTDFLSYKAGSFDAIVFVASLHHMNAEQAFRKSRELLAPNGVLLVVGCARPKTVLDWVVEIGRTPLAGIGTMLHHESSPGVITKYPESSPGEIKSLAKAILPGVFMRQALYYRYLLFWRKPPSSRGTAS